MICLLNLRACHWAIVILIHVKCICACMDIFNFRHDQNKHCLHNFARTC